MCVHVSMCALVRACAFRFSLSLLSLRIWPDFSPRFRVRWFFQDCFSAFGGSGKLARLFVSCGEDKTMT